MPYPKDVLVTDSEGREWIPTGDFDTGMDARSRLSHRDLVIAGCPMHLEAFEVEDDAEGLQQAKNPGLREELDHLQAIYDCRFITTTIAGREYVVFALPHGD